MPDATEIGNEREPVSGSRMPLREAILRNAPIAAALALALFIELYAGDYLVLRSRIAMRGATAATSTVTVFYAATLKDGNVNIFYDQPETQTCVRTIFPWLGYQPCWYLSRHAIKTVD
jgi:hypothetical protein